MGYSNKNDRRNEDFSRPSGEGLHSISSYKHHPFSGQLVDGWQAAKWLIDALSKTEQQVDLCSAFLRSEALNALLPKIPRQLVGRILVRWQLGDLQVGASDLRSYLVAKEFGFRFSIRQNFHGKVFSVPGLGVIVGSANATLAGFSLKEDGNAEVCTLVPSLDSNATFIDGLFDGAVEIDDVLFAEISQVLEDLPANSNEYVQWPQELMNKLCPSQSSNRILVSECLLSVPEIDATGLWFVADDHDRQLMRLHDAPVPRQTIAAIFKTLKLHNWLVDRLQQAEGEMYFGAVTAALHDSLLDDPVVYRCDVKILLQTLLSWYEHLPECGILVDRPNHSQRIRLG